MALPSGPSSPARTLPRPLRAAAAGLMGLYLLVLPFSSSVALRNVTLWTAFALVVAWMVWRRERMRDRMPPARLWVPMVCWAAWCALSVTWSVDPSHSATELRPELLTPLAAFMLFHVITEDADTFDRWAWALGAGLLIMAVLAFGQRIAHGAWDARRWHGDVGYYSTHAVAVLPMLAWAWLRAAGAPWARAAIVATGIATIVVTYWSDNRMAWPAFACMAAVAAFLAAHHQAPRHRQRIAALTLAAIAASAALFFMTQQHRQETLAARGVGITADLATDPRLRIWDEALGRIGEAPWVGLGFGRGTLRQPAATADGIQDPSQWHAHNLFLDVTLSLGAVGLVLFLWFWGALARELARAVKSPAPWRWGAILGLTLIVGFALKNATDDFFVRHVALLAWSLAGALAGLLRNAPRA